jgi:carboxyl-terminal processing protease
VVREHLKDRFYDSEFRGLDLDERFKEAEHKLFAAQSIGQVFGIIAQPLLDLNDTHTRFLPPGRAEVREYGWALTMIGEDCYVAGVRPDSDADKKGVRPGDRIMTLAGFKPSRANFWKVLYLLYTLRPLDKLPVVLRSPGQAEDRAVEIRARRRALPDVPDFARAEPDDYGELVREFERDALRNEHRRRTVGDDVVVWRVAAFDLGEKAVDAFWSEISGRKGLVLDLRGCPGGYHSALNALAGRLFDREVTVGEVRRRGQAEPWRVRPHARPFGGRLVVLIDGRTAATAEVLARLVQLEKRGTVIGDRSEGAVTAAQVEQFSLSRSPYPYGACVTVGEVFMADGRTLDGRGVRPDEILRPAPTDLRDGRDPALARAIALAGAEVSPAEADALFPRQWQK